MEFKKVGAVRAVWSERCARRRRDGPRHTSVPQPHKRVTDVTKAVTGCLECERLRGEVAELRRLLLAAERGQRREALTGAERMRRLRAKRRGGG